MKNLSSDQWFWRLGGCTLCLSCLGAAISTQPHTSCTHHRQQETKTLRNQKWSWEQLWNLLQLQTREECSASDHTGNLREGHPPQARRVARGAPAAVGRGWGAQRAEEGAGMTAGRFETSGTPGAVRHKSGSGPLALSLLRKSSICSLAKCTLANQKWLWHFYQNCARFRLSQERTIKCYFQGWLTASPWNEHL